MNAQATRLSAVSENIANADTTGYKQSQAEFVSLMLPSSSTNYNSGVVQANVRQLVSEQGGLSFTGNDSNAKKIDLAVDGTGFLAVSDGAGGTFLTRAGSFTQQADGSLVNAAGYTLQGYPTATTGTDAVLNGYAGLEDVNLKTSLLSANPTTKGILTVPLNKDFVVPGTKGVMKQGADFVNPLNIDPTKKLQFGVTVDGTTHVVTVSPDSNGDITLDNIVAAINSTGGLSGVAKSESTATGNILALTSNGTTNGPNSTVKLEALNIVDDADGTNPTALPAFAGLVSGAGTAGAAAKTPGDNTALSPTEKSTTSTSITVYTNSGEAVKLDIYYTKTDDAANKWEMAVFDSRGAANGPTAPFPYASGPISKSTLAFDSTNYTLSSITTGATVSTDGTLNISLGGAFGGSDTFKLDMGNTTQFSGNTQPLAASVDGNPAEVINKVNIAADGTITATFASGTSRALFKIPLAMVASPDSMTAHAGNVYSAGVESGTVLMGFGGSAGFGNLTAGALEGSTVDMASELTNMIQAQRSYTANSKVFQTGSEILDVLVNLKR